MERKSGERNEQRFWLASLAGLALVTVSLIPISGVATLPECKYEQVPMGGPGEESTDEAKKCLPSSGLVPDTNCRIDYLRDLGINPTSIPLTTCADVTFSVTRDFTNDECDVDWEVSVHEEDQTDTFSYYWQMWMQSPPEDRIRDGDGDESVDLSMSGTTTLQDGQNIRFWAVIGNEQFNWDVSSEANSYQCSA